MSKKSARVTDLASLSLAPAVDAVATPAAVAFPNLGPTNVRQALGRLRNYAIGRPEFSAPTEAEVAEGLRATATWRNDEGMVAARYSAHLATMRQMGWTPALNFGAVNHAWGQGERSWEVLTGLLSTERYVAPKVAKAPAAPAAPEPEPVPATAAPRPAAGIDPMLSLKLSREGFSDDQIRKVIAAMAV